MVQRHSATRTFLLSQHCSFCSYWTCKWCKDTQLHKHSFLLPVRVNGAKTLSYTNILALTTLFFFFFLCKQQLEIKLSSPSRHQFGQMLTWQFVFWSANTLTTITWHWKWQADELAAHSFDQFTKSSDRQYNLCAPVPIIKTPALANFIWWPSEYLDRQAPERGMSTNRHFRLLTSATLLWWLSWALGGLYMHEREILKETVFTSLDLPHV